MTRARDLLRVGAAVAALPFFMGVECEKALVKDSSFDVWCGEQLCEWQVDEGTIAKVPTWHERDYGVELQGPATRISQLLPFGSGDVLCLHFDLVADLAASASLILELDFDDDGVPEHSEVIPSGAWTPLDYRVATPSYYHGLRIALRKSGPGHAAVAQIKATRSSSDCTEAPPRGRAARPDGAGCEVAAQCASGRCVAAPAGAATGTCQSCTVDGDCPAGAVCGLTFAPEFSSPYPACVDSASRLLGDRCQSTAECATGNCCQGICSTCCGVDAACAAGDLCQTRARDPQLGPWLVPSQCGPGAGHGLPQTPCLSSDDCASARCQGEALLRICAGDGRRCAVNDDCPTPEQNPCIAVGVAGGRCE